MNPGKTNRRILVVDDDWDFAAHLKEWLTRDGFCVHVAQLGRAAIQFYTMYRPYAAVVLDLHMPKVDGFEVLHTIRSTDLECKVAVLTADPTAHDRALAAGADAFLVKPIGRTALCDHIRRLIRSRAGSEEAV